MSTDYDKFVLCHPEANVSCRNFPVKEDDLKKTIGLKDGGDEYIFFTAGKDKQKLMFHCRKEKHSSDESVKGNQLSDESSSKTFR